MENMKIRFDPSDVKAMCELMDRYGLQEYLNIGHNVNGEVVHISIFTDVIVVVTFQKNGWTRKNVYYRDGSSDETFDGKLQ